MNVQTKQPFQVVCISDAANQTVKFSVDNVIRNNVQLAIFTLDGKKVSNNNFQSSYSLNTAHYAIGTYFYTIASDHNESMSGKFIVQ